MNNILILREGIESDQPRLNWKECNLIILIKKNGTVDLLKNRYGSIGSKGKCGEIFDTNVSLEDRKFEGTDIGSSGIDYETMSV